MANELLGAPAEHDQIDLCRGCSLSPPTDECTAHCRRRAAAAVPVRRSPGPFFTRKQVALARHPALMVIVDNVVYDVSRFAADHPGGENLLFEHAGRDITKLLRDPDMHEHSESAYEVLEEYKVGRVVDDAPHRCGACGEADEDVVSELAVAAPKMLPPLPCSTTTLPQSGAGNPPVADRLGAGSSADAEFLDLTKPLMAQMARARFSKSFYLAQVHKPRHLSKPARFFANPLLELLTRTPWFLVPIAWLPYAGYLVWFALSMMSVPPATVVVAVVAGLVFWTVVEYTLHRFMFHVDDWMPESPLCFFLHFSLHGVHHLLPMDRLRLVMPPALLFVLQIPVSKLVFLCLPEAYAYPVLAGTFVGYVGYDMMHYLLHHVRPPFEHMREMKTHHLAHHYKDHHKGFGITSKVWDRVFGTLETPS